MVAVREKYQRCRPVLQVGISGVLDSHGCYSFGREISSCFFLLKHENTGVDQALHAFGVDSHVGVELRRIGDETSQIRLKS